MEAEGRISDTSPISHIIFGLLSTVLPTFPLNGDWEWKGTELNYDGGDSCNCYNDGGCIQVVLPLKPVASFPGSSIIFRAQVLPIKNLIDYKPGCWEREKSRHILSVQFRLYSFLSPSECT